MIKHVRNIADEYTLDGRTYVHSVNQYLWLILPPFAWCNDYATERYGASLFVVTSAARIPLSGCETYVFPATWRGRIKNFLELPGSIRGALDHVKAIEGFLDELNGEEHNA